MPYPGKLRIIAGKWRGRRLQVPAAPGLRPTPARARETLFNWLQNDIAGARCLDLFAGSGALGFEALSRGAAAVVMVEADAGLVQALWAEAQRLDSRGHSIERAEALDWLRRGAGPFDIILLDPPFRRGLIARCCALIKEGALLHENGVVYIEAEPGLAPPPGWAIIKQGRAAQAQFSLIRPCHSTWPEPDDQ